MYEKEKNAYFTVEASLIIPFILGGIVFVIYLGIFLYNVCAIRQTAYIAALRGSQITDISREEMETYVEEQVDKLLKNQILAMRTMEKKVVVTGHKIKVEVSTDIKMPFANIISELVDIWEIKGGGEAIRINPVDIIRNVRKINGSQISE